MSYWTPTRKAGLTVGGLVMIGLGVYLFVHRPSMFAAIYLVIGNIVFIIGLLAKPNRRINNRDHDRSALPVTLAAISPRKASLPESLGAIGVGVALISGGAAYYTATAGLLGPVLAAHGVALLGLGLCAAWTGHKRRWQ